MNGEIGIYSGEEPVGSGVPQNGVCGIAVWGDDPLTNEKDGAAMGDPLETKLLDDSVLHPVGYTVLSGSDVYQQDGFAVIRLTESNTLPGDFRITSIHPNPFNSRLSICYSLPEVADIKLNVFDLSGRLVTELISGRHQAGIYTTTLNGSDLASGIYIINYEAPGYKSLSKVTLVK